MEPDFSNICADQLEVLTKRLDSLKKRNIKDYTLAMYVINNEEACENLGATLVEVADIFNDVSKSIQILYVEALNKVQRKLKEHL